MPKQETETCTIDGHTSELSVFIYNHVPSWRKPPCNGTAVVRFELHKERHWLTVATTENSDPGKNDRRTTRETNVMIDSEGARALYEQLKAVFEHGK